MHVEEPRAANAHASAMARARQDMHLRIPSQHHTDLFEVALVEGTHCNVVSQGEIGGLQLECTLERVFCQLPATQKHIHQTPTHMHTHTHGKQVHVICI